MSTYFDSRDPACKSPFGAVPCGTEVSFAVFCTDEENIAGGELRVTEEFAGKEQAVPLSLSGGAWRCVYAAPAQPELAWYSFSLRRRSGETVTLAQRQLNACFPLETGLNLRRLAEQALGEAPFSLAEDEQAAFYSGCLARLRLEVAPDGAITLQLK